MAWDWEEEEESIQNRPRARRDSKRDGTNTLSRNVGFNREKEEDGGRSLFRIVHARGAIPNEMGSTHCRATQGGARRTLFTSWMRNAIPNELGPNC